MVDEVRSGDHLLVTVVIPSLNQAKYLESAILSVLRQAQPGKECIVIDGGSTDGSVEIIEKYQRDLAFWTSEPDEGQAHAIRKGFEHATGEVLTWLNSDDLMMPGALELVAEIMQADSGIAWLTGRSAIMDRKGRLVEIGPAMGRLRWFIERGWYHGRSVGGFIQQEGTFWRRKLWDRVPNVLRPEMAYALDFGLWREFSRHADLVTVNSVLAAFRYQESQKTSDINRYYDEVHARARRPPEWIRPVVLLLRSVLAASTWWLAPRVVYDRSRHVWRFKPGPIFHPGVR